MLLFALQFVDVNFELGTQFNKVIAPQDVALYGALCALASFDRADLKVLLSFLFKAPLAEAAGNWLRRSSNFSTLCAAQRRLAW
jgi:hypothetical protein